MGVGIVAAIGTLLALLLAVWNWWMKKQDEKRKLADEAQKMLEDGIAAGDTTLITSAFARLRRLQHR